MRRGNGDSERRHRPPARASRADPSPGRRRSDHDPRTTITKRVMVITVVLVDALYLAGEAILSGQNICP